MIVVDVETTGTNPIKHSLLSIGAIDTENPNEQFYEECRMWDGAHIDHVALETNGFSEDSIKYKNKKSEGEIVVDFFAWTDKCSNRLFAGHNPLFDIGFIQAAAERNHIDFKLAHRSIDLHTIAYMHMIKRGIVPPTKNKRSDINSDTVMKYVGIPDEPRPHIGINGAIWEAEALERLLYDRNLLPAFTKFAIPWLI